MRDLYILLLTVVFLVSAGLNLVSCENGTQSRRMETSEKQVEKPGTDTGGETIKEPTLDRIVEYQREAKAKLESLDKRLGELKNEVEKSGAAISDATKKEIEELNWKREYARKKLDELQSASVVAWNDIKSEMDSTINDLERSYEKISSELKGEQAHEQTTEPPGKAVGADQRESEEKTQ
jgi:predicted  nucleic acid-binding Zn-ribbon protein